MEKITACRMKHSRCINTVIVIHLSDEGRDMLDKRIWIQNESLGFFFFFFFPIVDGNKCFVLPLRRFCTSSKMMTVTGSLWFRQYSHLLSFWWVSSSGLQVKIVLTIDLICRLISQIIDQLFKKKKKDNSGICSLRCLGIHGDVFTYFVFFDLQSKTQTEKHKCLCFRSWN